MFASKIAYSSRTDKFSDFPFSFIADRAPAVIDAAAADFFLTPYEIVGFTRPSLSLPRFSFPLPPLSSLPNLFGLPLELQERFHGYLKAEWERLYDDGALEAELESWGLTEGNPWSWWKGHLKCWLTLIRILRVLPIDTPPYLLPPYFPPVYLFSYLFALNFVSPQPGFGVCYLRRDLRFPCDPSAFSFLLPLLFPPLSFLFGSEESAFVPPVAMVEAFFPGLGREWNLFRFGPLPMGSLLRLAYFFLFFNTPLFTKKGAYLASAFPAAPILLDSRIAAFFPRYFGSVPTHLVQNFQQTLFSSYSSFGRDAAAAQRLAERFHGFLDSVCGHFVVQTPGSYLVGVCEPKWGFGSLIGKGIVKDFEMEIPERPMVSAFDSHVRLHHCMDSLHSYPSVYLGPYPGYFPAYTEEMEEELQRFRSFLLRFSLSVCLLGRVLN